MTIVMTILASDNARNRRRAKRAAEREKKLTSKPVGRVQKAVNLSKVTMRGKPNSQQGGCCLPSVAIYLAGYRNTKSITAR